MRRPARRVWRGSVLALLLSLLAAIFRRRRRLRSVIGPAPDAAPGQVVIADDGVPLHVETDGDPAAPLTVVFVHGFTARLGEFDLQRAAIRDRARLVLWDQRGHGRSGWGNPRHATIEQTGRDLSAVLDQLVPTGPVVLLGHSLGGMTVLSLIRQRPELVGTRIVGAFLLATSARDAVGHGTLGWFVRWLARWHLIGLYLWELRLLAPVLERLRRRGTPGGRAAIRRYLFGRDDADPALVAMVQNMLEETSWTITSAFYASFLSLSHDETAALPMLARIPVTVLVGADDRLTPAANSRVITAGIGASAELIVVPGAGHSVNITRPATVDEALGGLLDRLTPRPQSVAG